MPFGNRLPTKKRVQSQNDMSKIAGENMSAPSSSGAAAGFLVNAAVSGLNAISQYAMNERNIEFQRETNETMRRDAWERWNANNAYNLPINQVQRLIAAGINPHLITGSTPVDAGSSDSASESPALTAPRGNPPQVASPISAVEAAQIANLNADANLKDAEAGKILKEYGLTDQQIEQLRLSNAIKRMDVKVVSQAYDDGLFGKAYRAGLQAAVNDTRLSTAAVLQAAMELAPVLGDTYEGALQLLQFQTDGVIPQVKKDDHRGQRVVQSGDLLIGYQWNNLKSRIELWMKENQASLDSADLQSFQAGLEKAEHQKDKEIYDWINGLVASDKRGERILGYILYGSLFLADKLNGNAFSWHRSTSTSTNNSTNYNVGKNVGVIRGE